MIVNKISNFFVSNPYFTGIVYVLILTLGDMLTRRVQDKFLICPVPTTLAVAGKYRAT